MNARLFGSFVLALTSLLGSVGRAAEAPAKPNILFILADDLGIDGVSCYGADKHQTPQIDALAKTGTRFEICYAAPLCGPSRCLYVTGQYAFHTGGLTNGSWGNGGTGPRAAGSSSVAKTLKQAGYATGQSGKWRQVGDTPREWGFDEYLTDPTAGGYYWEKSYTKDDTLIKTPDETYQPDVEQAFVVDFITHHQDKPFFCYYAMHLVHKPTVVTTDSKAPAGDLHKARHENDPAYYDDTIHYMDKQVGELMSLLEKLKLREKTLVVFSGDNGTAKGYGTTVHGREIVGTKGTMFEGGSRVPMIVSWPGVTPAGKFSPNIVSFADLHATFAEIGGAPLAAGKSDGISFAPQIRGEAGQPRKWAYVQLGENWFVREKGWKMNQAFELFDMSDAPYAEKKVAPDSTNADAVEARARLTAILKSLDPGSSKFSESKSKREERKDDRKSKKKKKGDE